jgi:hypothetical protein
MLKRLKIGWKDYEVEEKEPDGDLISGGDICYGRIHYDDPRIIINSKYSKSQKVTTLIHEAIHGIDELYDLDLTEKQVVCLGNGFAMLIKDNPSIIKAFKALYKSTSE